jgi:hypothetical protein
MGGIGSNIQENIMLKKSLIAAAAVASVVGFASGAAKADPHVTIGFGFGTDGYFPGFMADPYPYMGHRHRPHHFRDYEADIDYGVSCNQARNIVRSAGFHNVYAYDCSAPTYGYKAVKHGDLFKIKVSYSGDIISVRPIY